MTDAPGSINLILDSIALNSAVSDNLVVSDDIDYFKISASAIDVRSVLTIDFSGLPASVDEDEFSISIRDSSDQVIVQTQIGSSGSLATTVDAGAAYYVRVSKGADFRQDSYSLTTSLQPLAEIEGNDNATSASLLLENSVTTAGTANVVGRLGTALEPDGADVDWYYFTTGSTVGTSVTLSMSASDEEADYYEVAIYDASLTEPLRNQSGQQLKTIVGTNDGTLSFSVTGASGLSPKGTYYVRVSAIDSQTFGASAEAGQSYTLTLSGTTDFNVAPVITIDGQRSGSTGSLTNTDVVITNNRVVDPDVAVQDRVFARKLTDLIEISDGNTSQPNNVIASYSVGLLNEGAYPQATGIISYTDDDTGLAVNINAATSFGGAGFFSTLSAAEFATASYSSPNITQSQRIYVFVTDQSGVSSAAATLNNPNDTSGIISFTMSTSEILGELPAINTQPEFTSTAVTSVQQDANYSYQIVAVDADAGDTLTLSATKPDWLSFDAAAGVLSGTPDNGDVGDHAVSLRVTDAAGLYDTQSFIIQVTNLVDGALQFWKGGAAVVNADLTISVDGGEASVSSDAAGLIDLDAYKNKTISLQGVIQDGVADLVDLLDVLAVLDHISGTAPFSNYGVLAADVDQSGEVDLIDALAVLDIISSQSDAELRVVDSNYQTEITLAGDDVTLTAIVVGDTLGTYSDLL